jgi:uncharacterized protein (DUF1800 family)
MLPVLPAAEWSRARAVHLLNRAGFGGDPAAVSQLHQLGLARAVDSLLEFGKVAESVTPPSWAKPDPELFQKVAKARMGTDEEKRKAQAELRRIQAGQMQELRGWWLARMRETGRPLQEKLVLFWHGHFATSVEKVRSPYYMWLQNETFRRHASGNWQAMLQAVSRDPAMVIWLDNQQNRRERPNENYARELMELFTLGEGHYTEKDIQESARAFTGWGVNPRQQAYEFRARSHDDGEKTFFGQRGNWNGDDIVRIILDQPQAARFITGKLWTFFAGTKPSEEVLAGLGASLRAAKWEFAPVLREMFMSRAFHAREVMGTQVKSPVQLLVSTCKALDCELPPPASSSAAMRTLGQSLFEPPNVKGWDGGIAWVSTGSLFNRYNYSGALVMGTTHVTGFGKRAQLATASPANAAPPEMMREEMRAEVGEMMADGATPAEAKQRIGARVREAVKGAAERARPLHSAAIDVASLVPKEQRGTPAAIVDSLIARLFVARPTEKERESFLAFLTARPNPPSDADYRELAHLMMSTARFQLC